MTITKRNRSGEPLRRRKRETLIRSADFMEQFHPAACVYSDVHARTVQGDRIYTAVMTSEEFDAWSRSK